MTHQLTLIDELARLRAMDDLRRIRKQAGAQERRKVYGTVENIGDIADNGCTGVPLVSCDRNGTDDAVFGRDGVSGPMVGGTEPWREVGETVTTGNTSEVN